MYIESLLFIWTSCFSPSVYGKKGGRSRLRGLKFWFFPKSKKQSVNLNFTDNCVMISLAVNEILLDNRHAYRQLDR